MGEQVQLSGTVSASPATASDGQFPSATVSIPFNLNPSTKPFNVATGGIPIVINSPSSFVAIPGVGGAVGPVTQAQLIYGRVSSAMQFRLTFTGDGTAKVMYVGGLFIIEVDPSHPVTLFEVQGSGTLELFATGIQ